MCLQSKMSSEGFSAPYTSTTILCLMAGVQCAGISAAVDRSLEPWKLGLDIRLYSVIYIVRNNKLSLLCFFSMHLLSIN
jgi:hypothetical protein